MTDEELAEEINEILKDKRDYGTKDILVWWLETGLDAFSGRTPAEVFDEGYGEQVLQYVKDYNG